MISYDTTFKGMEKNVQKVIQYGMWINIINLCCVATLRIRYSELSNKRNGKKGILYPSLLSIAFMYYHYQEITEW